jgi:hypothetical protein
MTWLDTLGEKALARELPTRAEALRVLDKRTSSAPAPLPLHGCAVSRHTPQVLWVITGSRYVCKHGDPCP